MTVDVIQPSSSSMTPLEIKSTASLASIFALRMFGLFLILPVFSVYATQLSGGQNAFLVGLAMGMYGLTQAFGQIPFGMASDKYGRKPVIILGLLIFGVGSIIAACADHIVWVIVGRAVQGMGAISAAVTAFIADATRVEHRTKAMAMVGGSIGITFALSLVGGPLLYKAIGMPGIFLLMAVLSILAIGVVKYIVPEAPLLPVERVSFTAVLRNAELMRLNYGVFVLHMMQVAMFVVVPSVIVENLGMPIATHWKIYLPIMLVSFVLMIPPIWVGEKKGKTKQVFVGSILLLLLVQFGLWQRLTSPVFLVALLLAFFVAFNLLEASLPSLVSRLAPQSAKGTALGVYNTLQSLGLFCGGALGGWLKQHASVDWIFILGVGLTAVWLIIAYGMQNILRRDVAASA